VINSPLLFCGNSNPSWPKRSPKRLRLHVGSALVSEFRMRRRRVEIGENVRGAEVFVSSRSARAPNGKGVNDSRDGAAPDDRRACGARRPQRITAVIPYYGYAKQDKKTKGREPISAKLVANLLAVAGGPGAS
jgi:ribose-phosphate pyrophosphokinase